MVLTTASRAELRNDAEEDLTKDDKKKIVSEKANILAVCDENSQ